MTTDESLLNYNNYDNTAATTLNVTWTRKRLRNNYFIQIRLIVEQSNK